jgi:hypothetical protein
MVVKLLGLLLRGRHLWGVPWVEVCVPGCLRVLRWSGRHGRHWRRWLLGLPRLDRWDYGYLGLELWTLRLGVFLAFAVEEEADGCEEEESNWDTDTGTDSGCVAVLGDNDWSTRM